MLFRLTKMIFTRREESVMGSWRRGVSMLVPTVHSEPSAFSRSSYLHISKEVWIPGLN